MSEFTVEPGWLQRQIKNVEREVSQWSDSMKIAAGIDPATNQHPVQVELDRTKAELQRTKNEVAFDNLGIAKLNGQIATLHTKLAKVTEELDRLREVSASA